MKKLLVLTSLLFMVFGMNAQSWATPPKVPVIRRILKKVPVPVDRNAQTWHNRYNSPHYQPANYGTGGASYNSPEAQPYYRQRWAGQVWYQTTDGYSLEDPRLKAAAGKVDSRTERYREVTEKRKRREIVKLINKQGPAMKACADQVDRYGTMSLDCAEMLGFVRDSAAVYTPNMLNPYVKKRGKNKGEFRRGNDKKITTDFPVEEESQAPVVDVDSSERIVLPDSVLKMAAELVEFKKVLTTQSAQNTPKRRREYMDSYRRFCWHLVSDVYPNKVTLKNAAMQFDKLFESMGISADSLMAVKLWDRYISWGNSEEDPAKKILPNSQSKVKKLPSPNPLPTKASPKPAPTATKKVVPNPSSTFTPSTVKLKDRYVRRAEKKIKQEDRLKEKLIKKQKKLDKIKEKMN